LWTNDSLLVDVDAVLAKRIQIPFHSIPNTAEDCPGTSQDCPSNQRTVTGRLSALLRGGIEGDFWLSATVHRRAIKEKDVR
jgi:hypothetical protein